MPESFAAIESWKVARIERPSVVLCISRCTARIRAAEIATRTSRDCVMTTGPRNSGLLANGERTFSGLVPTNTAQLVVGTSPEKVLSPFANKPLFLGPVVITQSRLVLVAISAALILAVHLLIQRTTLGRSMRATFQDSMAAKLSGIRTSHVYGFTFALGAALAGAAGMLLGSIYVAQATIGDVVSLKAFVVVILGGMGSF